jgi:excisionase family DNA binding protein
MKITSQHIYKNSAIRFYTPHEIAEMFGIHWRTVHREIFRGRISAYKVGSVYRISEESLQNYLHSRKVN